MMREVGEKPGRCPVPRTERVLKKKQRSRVSVPQECHGRNKWKCPLGWRTSQPKQEQDSHNRGRVDRARLWWAGKN